MRRLLVTLILAGVAALAVPAGASAHNEHYSGFGLPANSQWYFYHTVTPSFNWVRWYKTGGSPQAVRVQIRARWTENGQVACLSGWIWTTVTASYYQWPCTHFDPPPGTNQSFYLELRGYSGDGGTHNIYAGGFANG